MRMKPLLSLTCPNCGQLYTHSRKHTLEYELSNHMRYQHKWSSHDAYRYLRWVQGEPESLPMYGEVKK